MIVEEARWQALEQELHVEIRARFPEAVPDGFEVHGGDLRHGTRFFKGVSVAERVEFRDRWLSIAPKHGVRLVYRAIVKKRYSNWLAETFGAGVFINPHVVAFCFGGQGGQ